MVRSCSATASGAPAKANYAAASTRSASKSGKCLTPAAILASAWALLTDTRISRLRRTPLLLCKSADADVCCQLGIGFCSCGCKSPSTICKSQGQCCCLVENAAFPTDDEIPCTCACFGLACYPGCGCCKTLGALKGKGAPAGKDVEGAPEDDAMER